MKRFAYPVLLREGGKGEYVYHLRKRPKTVMTALRHMLQINEVRIAFALACGKCDGINLVEFIPEYRGVRRDDGRPGRAVEDSVAVRNGSEHQGTLIPDAVVCLEQAKTGNRALFFLEVDLGSEKLVSMEPGRYSLLKKMLLYNEYLKTKGFKRYNEMFDYEFKGFRVLTLMDNAKRIQVLRRELTKRGIQKFVWFAKIQEISRQTLFDPMWLRADPTDVNAYSIIRD